VNIHKLVVKSIIDRSLGVSLTLLSMPIILTFMLLIRLETIGFPIFSQLRVGLHTKPFRIFKLRSMRVNDGQQFSTTVNDERITRIGKIIRKTSIDELPQFWNLLNGQMSLIGPRPDVPEQREIYTEREWLVRHQVKPGMTGLAQALLRSKATINQRKRLDLFYATKCNLYLDVYVVLKTLKNLFAKDFQN
jgi:lipopolysaccharide/colanic/teichoic acid biosynthesis glycosyltransferase